MAFAKPSTVTEATQAFYNTYQQAAAEGISVFGASGDEGPSSCSADFSAAPSMTLPAWALADGLARPTTYPWAEPISRTSTTPKEGGAPLSTYWNATNTAGYGSAMSYIPEIPWNDACANVLISEVATRQLHNLWRHAALAM